MADEPATKHRPEKHDILYWFKGVLVFVVFFMVVFGFMALDDYTTHGADSLLTAVGLFSSALVIVVIMFALGWFESVPDSPKATSARARSRPPAPPLKPRTPSQAASDPARARPKVGEPVLVSTSDGEEIRGMATRIEYGMVTVMLNDGKIARFDETDCALCDER